MKRLVFFLSLILSISLNVQANPEELSADKGPSGGNCRIHREESNKETFFTIFSRGAVISREKDLKLALTKAAGQGSCTFTCTLLRRTMPAPNTYTYCNRGDGVTIIVGTTKFADFEGPRKCGSYPDLTSKDRYIIYLGERGDSSYYLNAENAAANLEDLGICSSLIRRSEFREF